MSSLSYISRCRLLYFEACTAVFDHVYCHVEEELANIDLVWIVMFVRVFKSEPHAAFQSSILQHLHGATALVSTKSYQTVNQIQYSILYCKFNGSPSLTPTIAVSDLTALHILQTSQERSVSLPLVIRGITTSLLGLFRLLTISMTP